MTFRAGDHVHHKPSGERWVLACDEEHGEVIACGWPETHAKAADCELLTAAPDSEREALLLQVAKSNDSSLRSSRARHQLTSLPHPPCMDCVGIREQPALATRRSGESVRCDEHHKIAVDRATTQAAEALTALRVLENANAISAPAEVE